MNRDNRLLQEAYLKVLKEGWREDEGNYPLEGDDEETYRSNRQYAKSGGFSKASDNASFGSHTTPSEAPVLKKYTYEILYATDHKYDPKTKKAISWSYASHSSGRPDIRHVFATSKEEAMKEITGSSSDSSERYKILSEVPADPKEVEHEKSKGRAISDYYDQKSKTGGYSGD